MLAFLFCNFAGFAHHILVVISFSCSYSVRKIALFFYPCSIRAMIGGKVFRQTGCAFSNESYHTLSESLHGCCRGVIAALSQEALIAVFSRPALLLVCQNTVMARFERRLNRFLAEVKVGDDTFRVQVPNPARLQELLVPGRQVLLCKNNGKKTSYALYGVKHERSLIGIDSRIPNFLLEKQPQRGCCRNSRAGRSNAGNFRLKVPSLTF